MCGPTARSVLIAEEFRFLAEVGLSGGLAEDRTGRLGSMHEAGDALMAVGPDGMPVNPRRSNLDDRAACRPKLGCPPAWVGVKSC